MAEVAYYGQTKAPELYRITYDGWIADEPHFVVMGGSTEPIISALKDSYIENADLSAAVATVVNALQAGGTNVEQRTLTASTLEIAVLVSNRPRRAFRRITGSALEALLPQSDPPAEETKTAAD